MPTSLKAKVLIVDDREDNILAMQVVLKDCPEYELFTATSGFAALDLVKENDFALILLDLQMPVMDGYETAAEIKKLERGKDVPIIMVTAIYKEDPHILRGYSVGAIDYIGKPYNEEVLKTKVGIYANLYIKSRQIILQNKFLHEAELALTDEKRSQTVLESMPVGVIVTDKTGQITQMNREAYKIWSKENQNPLKHYSEMGGWWASTGNPLKANEWPVIKAVEKGETSQYDIIEILCFDGTKKTILNSASPVRNSQGQITGAVDVMQDISKQTALSPR